MPTNNMDNDIINRLIDNQKSSSLDDQFEDDGEENMEVINKSRVIGLKYKLYLFLSVIGIYILASNFVSPAWNQLESKKDSLSSLQSNVKEFDARMKLLQKDKAFIGDMMASSGVVVSCLNEQKSCSQISSGLREQFSIVRSYLQIGDLSSIKMVVNEKLILANINEYLIRNMQEGDVTKIRNGNIDRIAIGEPVQFDGKLYYVPVRLNVSFDNKDYLLDFISNVERKILLDKEYRILYKIDQVSYDIVEYQDEQSVDIVLVAYYYQN